MARRDREPDPEHEIDLRGLGVEQAKSRLAQELHACRYRGIGEALVITGRGWGNPSGEPVLVRAIGTWLEGEGAARLGVRRSRPTHKGGAFVIEIDLPGGSRTHGA